MHHHLQALAGDGRVEAGGNAEADQPGAGAGGAARGENRRTGRSHRPGDDHHQAERPLVGVVGTVGKVQLAGGRERRGPVGTERRQGGDGDGHPGVVGEGDGDAGVAPVDADDRRAAAAVHHLDGVIGGDAQAELTVELHHRLLGRPARGEALRPGAAATSLRFGEDLLGEPRVTPQRPSMRLIEVMSTPSARPWSPGPPASIPLTPGVLMRPTYSTVTDLARLRGRSTSQPRRCRRGRRTAGRG